jgi:hypothetical protein
LFPLISPALAQSKGGPDAGKTAAILARIDGSVVREFGRAWHLSGNGRVETLVLISWQSDGSLAAQAQPCSAAGTFCRFPLTSRVVAIAHTHPESGDERPSNDDVALADRFGLPVFTLTRRGMYVYDPDTKKVRELQVNLDWLNPAKWAKYSLVAANR